MMSYKTGFISLAAVTATVLLLAFASSAVAERGPEHRPHFGMPGFFIERMAERLDLDETQRQEIENILLAAKPEFEALRDRVQAEVEAVLKQDWEELMELIVTGQLAMNARSV